ncbi:hypothetical protein RZS08_59165, partial [Arthrospira platensis SPKY1]|nr:hypothetical protein [Arthrospira platensis SPKY1]
SSMRGPMARRCASRSMKAIGGVAGTSGIRRSPWRQCGAGRPRAPTRASGWHRRRGNTMAQSGPARCQGRARARPGGHQASTRFSPLAPARRQALRVSTTSRQAASSPA